MSDPRRHSVLGPSLPRQLEEVGATGIPAAPLSELQNRLSRAGIALLECDAAGKIRSSKPECILHRLCELSPLFARELKKALKDVSKRDESEACEIVPGLWTLPIQLMNRRKRSGYAVALIPTNQFLRSEQFLAMCQSAALDAELCRSQLNDFMSASVASGKSGPTNAQSHVPHDMRRFTALIRDAYRDQCRAASDANAIESVGKQLADSYEEMNLLYTITQSMTVQERPERFIALACKELLATLPYAWIGLQLSTDRAKLKSLAGRLIFAGAGGADSSNASRQQAIRSLALKLLSKANPKEPLVLETRSNTDDSPFAPMGATVAAHPVVDIRDDQIIGLLIAGDKQGDDTAVTNIDIKLLGATATHMAIFLENAALYDDLNAMFLGTLEALTASIDAKDRYTCGHSRRVAHLTQSLAEQIGLDEHTVSRCRIAGLVHDVGKIGVPEAVLTKPGKLTDDEFAWIRKHPEIGYRILKDIPQLSDVLPGVLHHHERWDGTGYPEGLSGEAIPLVARLIALADSFDAMSSNRTYRQALTRDAVLAEIQDGAGKQFDATLVRAFLGLKFDQYDRMSREHQASEAAGSRAPSQSMSISPGVPREKAA